MEIHCHFVKNWVIFNNDSFMLVEFFGLWIPFKNKELIGLLLIHNKDLTRNDSQLIFIFRLCDGNDSIGFPCISLEKLNGHCINLLE
jgi:hypothetical protein